MTAWLFVITRRDSPVATPAAWPARARDADGPSFGTGWAWVRDRTTTENAAALVDYLTDACTSAEFGGISPTTWSPTDQTAE